ncbi:hypothetical protein [Paenilisteria newyorkensis]|uniref:hypothetical protein n=1 Tax=Listeria newyorkensis TaxID=1497681 RepID=UPI000669F0BC|nr:hypothetical protein [Listeria newyorkensis]KMT63012.1 hypothetical protein X559_0654 [Listeria newyorkensis]
MDVKYKESEWDKSKNALGTLVGLGVWGKGVIDQLKKINTNFEDAQNDIRKDDRDGVISFSFTDMESKYQTLFEKIEVLHDYAGDAGNMVERVIDEPFYKDIDKFVEKMENLSIDDYETKNTIGATTIITTGGYDYGSYGATTTTVPKDKIKLSDIMAGDNFFADNLKAQFAEYSKQNPDQEFTYEQYQSAVSSSRAFEYESIRDEQQSREFWRDIGIAVVIIGVSILCPPAGLALGVAYGTLELTSVATGKDWMTGREMDGTERATRGAFALLDIIPGVKGIRAFSTATKAGGLALDAAQAGSKLTLRQTAKQGLSHMDAMGRQALRESAERIRNVPRVISDVASTVKNTAQEGLTTVKKMTANFGDNMRNLNFGGERLVAEGFGFVDDVAKNTDDVVLGVNKIVKSGGDKVGADFDEVATGPRYGDRRIPDDLYDELREATPTPELRNKVNEGVELPIADPAIPGKEVTKRLEADHIVSMDKITRMEGFEKLTKEEQLKILNYEENFTGLSRSANASKGSKSFEEWTIYKKEGIPIDPAFREKMIVIEKDLGIQLQSMIDDILKGR